MSDPNDWMLAAAPPPEAERKGWWARLPRPAAADPKINDPSLYDPPAGLLDALNAALILGQPLLLTGDPGCGKTDAAHYLAWRLGLDHGGVGGDFARRFDVKSTTAARDLFYSFDVIGRFYAAQVKDDTSAELFLTLNALGRAIVEASEESDDQRTALLGGTAAAPRRSVVLVDEIDKAPRDVPNDLLVEFEKLRFHVAEIDRTFVAAPAFRPIVVLTSNRERELPDAFLRRCIVFTVPFPEPDTLASIVRGRIGGVSDELIDDSVDLAVKLRRTSLRRKPGTAELLSFVAALKGVGVGTASFHDLANWPQIARTTLLKNSLDHDTVTSAMLSDLAG